MKNYKEVAETVLERRDAYQKTQNHKRNVIIRTTAGGGILCLMALLGFRIYQSSIHSHIPEKPLSDPDVYYVLSESSSLGDYGSDSLPDTDSMAEADPNNPVGNTEGGSLANPSDSNDGNGLANPAGSNDGNGLANPAGNNGLAASTDDTDSDGMIASAESSGSNTTPPGQETASEENGMLPVSYSSLSLPQGQVRPEIISEYAASGHSVADVLPFSEDMLSDSSAILEGRITDMYLKHYSYDTYNDKFGPKEVYHNQASSVVYELTVDKVWYGDESLCGTSVLIEDDIYLIDSYFSLKVGRSYVIPVSDLDEEKWIWGEYAGGDLTRDGRYTTLYPHHPQIEVTSDGDYIVTTDWETLCPDSANPIWLDIPESSFVEYHPENKAGKDDLITTEWRTLLISPYDMVYYYDKLKLVSSNEFFIQLNHLVDQLP